jgi:NAD(P)-dependent dehydrogenase (short-subunit alcohol dehydrogenase family)
MAGELAGQVAIVTGGGRGIGRAIAQALAAVGAAVAVTARTEDQLRETVALIEQAGGHALAVAGDVTDPATVERTMRAVEERLGPVDVLVNNAAVLGPDGGVADGDAQEWWQAFAVNLYAPFLWSQAVLPGMIARRRGHIIHVASSGAFLPLHRGDVYGVSKAALLRLAEGMAAEGRDHGVAVFAVHPGAVWTDMARENMRRWPEVYPGGLEDPGRYTATPPEAPARLCVALASGRADALSGRYVSVREDLDALIDRAAEIRQQDLYTLRLRR